MRMPFVFELGCEEMPASLLPSILQDARSKFESLLAEARLPYSDLRVYATPRRLVLWVGELAAVQEDRLITARGPSRTAAFDEKGKPTRAAEGFARSQGVAVSDLEIRDTPSGEYVYAVRIERGEPALCVLERVLPSFVRSLEFPRAMRWGDLEFSFIRPIRWVLCLLGTNVVSFELAGVKSSRVSRGHRLHFEAPVMVDEASGYFDAMRSARVMIDQDERREEIVRRARAMACELGGEVVLPEELLEEVVYLCEWPGVFRGTIDSEFLSLPREVITTTMQHHLRFFPVQKDGRLLPYFIAVRNGEGPGLDNVVAGCERVITARLKDARFFYSEDTSRSLEDRVPELARIVFQEKLGTVHSKVMRVQSLVQGFGHLLSEEEKQRALRAAYLCKADLTTHLVYEFPELEGYVGRELALHDGEHPVVATAILEHHLPRRSGGAVPATPEGVLVSVCDKLDTLAGYFLIGKEPTGSQDPLGLRRAGFGVISVLWKSGLRLDLREAVERAVANYDGFDEHHHRAAAALQSFLVQRAKVLFTDEGVRPDIVDAVLYHGIDLVERSWRKIQALREFLTHEKIEDLLLAYKRVMNLARNAGEGEVREHLLVEQPEIALYRALKDAEAELRTLYEREDFRSYLEKVVELRGPVDEFLDRTLVMVEDEAIRRNRLALLRKTGEVLGRVAELGELR
ncbi:MAG: glycine--tRNA ligase subunit beta [Bacillota bacterium]